MAREELKHLGMKGQQQDEKQGKDTEINSSGPVGNLPVLLVVLSSFVLARLHCLCTLSDGSVSPSKKTEASSIGR